MSPEFYRVVFLALVSGLWARAIIGALNVDIDYRLAYDDRACTNYYEMRQVFAGLENHRPCYAYDEWHFIETEGAGWEPDLYQVCLQLDRRQIETGVRDLHCERGGLPSELDYYAVRDERAGEWVTVEKRERPIR